MQIGMRLTLLAHRVLAILPAELSSLFGLQNAPFRANIVLSQAGWTDGYEAQIG